LVGPRLTLGESEAVKGLLINIGASNAEHRQKPEISNDIQGLRSLVVFLTINTVPIRISP
jgi:hypothetical protein